MNILNKSAESTNKQVTFIKAISKLCAVLFIGSSIFLFSVKTATANDAKKFNFPETLTKADRAAIQSSNGRYKIELTSMLDNRLAYWYVIVYDTQTGRSKFYYGNVKDGTRAADPKYQLPTKPL